MEGDFHAGGQLSAVPAHVLVEQLPDGVRLAVFEGLQCEAYKEEGASNWLIEHQSDDGLWENSYKKKTKGIDTERAGSRLPQLFADLKKVLRVTAITAVKSLL